MYCFNQIFKKASQKQLQKYRAKIFLGFLAATYAIVEKKIVVHAFVDRFSKKIESNGCDVYFDNLLRPAGFVIWNFNHIFSKKNPSLSLNESDANESRSIGKNLEIEDFFFNGSDILPMLRGVRQYLLPRAHSISYSHRTRARTKTVCLAAKAGLRTAPATCAALESSDFLGEVRNDLLEKCEDSFTRWAQMGAGLVALSLSKLHRDIPLEQAATLLTIASEMGQIKIYWNDAGQPTGLVTWAWLSRRTIERLEKGIQAPMHPCEWNEGDVLCFRDIAVTSESAAAVAEDLSGGLFPEVLSCMVLVQDRVSKEVVLFPVQDGARDSLGRWVLSKFLQK